MTGVSPALEPEPVAEVSAVPLARDGVAVASADESPRWWRPYVTWVRWGDAAAIMTAVLVAYFVGLNRSSALIVSGTIQPSYHVVAALIVLVWTLAVAFGDTCDRRIIGNGNTEYQRIVGVSWRLFTALGLASFLLKMSTGRWFLGTAFVLGTFLLLVNRWAARKWLHAQRRHGASLSRVLVVGPPAKAARLSKEFERHPFAGYGVAGICVPTLASASERFIGSVPVLGDFAQVADVALREVVDLVAVAGADDMTAEALQALSWDLEGSGIDISVTLSLVDVAGPRFLLQPAGNLPLVFVDAPAFSGPKFVLKSVVDWAAAAVLVLLMSPVLLAAALAVKLTSPGPVLYRQTRIGRNGRAFSIFKFRSMYRDADERLDEVMSGEVGLFYKRQDDPRVTPVGRFLRRYSIDELPQLFNVLRGQMSLVGPRPQIEREVALYDRKAHRRLLVKPGLTGLWQVSGRSRLSAEDSIRLDVYYVENWTLFGDLLILMRTLKAVVGADGAY